MPELPVSWRCILRLSALTAQHIKRRQLPARTAQQDSLLAAPATPMHPGQRSKLTNHLALLLLLLLLCLMMVPQVQAAPTETETGQRCVLQMQQSSARLQHAAWKSWT